MKGLKYQLKNIRRDKMCILTFLLPIIAGIAIHLLSGVNLQTVSEASFGILKNDLSQEASLWLKANGNLTQYETPEELYWPMVRLACKPISGLRIPTAMRRISRHPTMISHVSRFPKSRRVCLCAPIILIRGERQTDWGRCAMTMRCILLRRALVVR